jgi:carboxyl-terminal processing protease
MQLKRWLGVLWLVIAAVSAVQAKAEPRIALVIGNANYTAEIGVLPNPVNDARLIAKTLQQVGFQVLSVEDADHAELNRTIEALSTLLDKAGPETTALVYYAGKGVQIEGRAYILPTNASWKGPLSADQQGVAVDAILTVMARAKTRLLFFDASRRQPPTTVDSKTPVQAFSEVETLPGTIVAFSTSPGQVAADGDGTNSPFAMALSRAILTPGLASDQVLRQVRIDVIDATGQRQVPWTSSALVDPFYFLPEK